MSKAKPSVGDDDDVRDCRRMLALVLGLTRWPEGIGGGHAQPNPQIYFDFSRVIRVTTGYVRD